MRLHFVDCSPLLALGDEGLEAQPFASDARLEFLRLDGRATHGAPLGPQMFTPGIPKNKGNTQANAWEKGYWV